MVVSYGRRLLFVFGSLIPLFCFMACQKNNNTNNSNTTTTNAAYVDIYIYVNTPEFFPLTTIGGWIYKTGGTKGIIIYRKSQSEFAALERSCPYDGVNKTNALVKVQSDNISAKDSICGSKFYITDGSVTTGPATYPLGAYHTTFDGNALHIFN